MARYEALHPPGSTINPNSSAVGAFLQSLLPWLQVPEMIPERGVPNEGVNAGIIQNLIDQINNGPIPENVRNALRQLIDSNALADDEIPLNPSDESEDD